MFRFIYFDHVKFLVPFLKSLLPDKHGFIHLDTLPTTEKFYFDLGSQTSNIGNTNPHREATETWIINNKNYDSQYN